MENSMKIKNPVFKIGDYVWHKLLGEENTMMLIIDISYVFSIKAYQYHCSTAPGEYLIVHEIELTETNPALFN